MKIILIIIVLLSTSVASAESRHTICTECEKNMKDNEDLIFRSGYGRGCSQEEADSIAKRNAYIALLKVLQTTVKQSCRDAKIKNDGEKYFLEIRYYNRKEIPERYFFEQDSILVNTPIFCINSLQSKKGIYYTCCVLTAQKKDIYLASNHVLCEMFLRMLIKYM